MCGLFGAMSTSLTGAEVDDLVDLGLLSSLRGRDSTGIITASHKKNGKNNIMHYKDVTDSSDFLHRRETQEMLAKAFFVAGHCRAATIGKINVHNSHPIQEGKILGMHNGTIHTFRPDKDKEDVSSDSREFYKHLAEHGVDSAVDKAGYGAYALVWLDLNHRTVNFLRNGQRPLYWVRRSGTIYWASERVMLQFMLARSTIKPAKEPDIDMLEVDTLYTIPLNEPLAKPKVRKLKQEAVSAVPLVRPGFGRGSHHHGTQHGVVREHIGPAQPYTPPEYKPIHQRVAENFIRSMRQAHEEPIYIGYDNQEWTKSEAEKKLKMGCTNCRLQKEVTDTVFFSSAVDWFCEDCKDLPIVQNNVRGLYKGGLKDEEVDCG